MTTIAKERNDFYKIRSVESEQNIHHGIPWNLIFPKIGSIIPVIPKGYQILWTAGSGIGKSQTWIGIIMYSIYKLKSKHIKLNLKTKIIIALLEDTREMFVDRLYSMILYDKFKIKVTGFQLQSMGETLSKEHHDKIDIVQKDVELLLEDCEIIDSVYHPTGIYKWCRSISNEYGKHIYKDKEFVNDDGTKYKKEIYAGYELKEEYKDHNFMLILDNLNNLSPEKVEGKMLTERETINTWSRRYCRLKITKHWKWTVLNVIQQAAESERPQYDHRGNLVIEKIKPSLDALGNSKECQRDHYIVFGVFAPARFGIAQYPQENGYNTELLSDNFRSLIILKSNLSISNVEIPLYFDGGMSMVRELPTVDKMTPEYYDSIRKLQSL